MDPFLSQLYEALSFLKQLGAVVLVHAENGDLIAQVSALSPPLLSRRGKQQPIPLLAPSQPVPLFTQPLNTAVYYGKRTNTI